MSRITRNVILSLTVMGMAAVLEAQTPPPVPSAPANTNAAEAGATNAIGPRIRFATPVYDFGRVKSGEAVKYTYIFTNIGDQVLEISNVHPQCGCTTAGEYTKSVQPGCTGSIPIQFNSGNYPAGQVIKATSVTCNDKTQPTVALQLKGTLWKPVDLIPALVWLNLPPDVPSASMIVRIVNNTDEPMTLQPPECTSKSFAFQLTNTIPGKECQLTVRVVPPLPVGNTPGQVTLKTSLSNAPALNLPVYANVQPAVTVIPSQIPLPMTPLPNKMSQSITIQNNGTNALSLSDPSFSLEGVDVQVNTLQTGRVYSIALGFPQGFAIPQGQSAIFTVKTSHPQFPSIRVPVVQMPRPIPVNRPPVQAQAVTATPGAAKPAGQRAVARPVPPPPMPLPANN